VGQLEHGHTLGHTGTTHWIPGAWSLSSSHGGSTAFGREADSGHEFGRDMRENEEKIEWFT
jgi:hypothetical protein